MVADGNYVGRRSRNTIAKNHKTAYNKDNTRKFNWGQHERSSKTVGAKRFATA